MLSLAFLVGVLTAASVYSAPFDCQDPLTATCDLIPDPLAPFAVTGHVTFTQYEWCVLDDLHVNVSLSGFPENNGTERLRGFHVHEHGNITGGCASAGGHYNPFYHRHAGPGDFFRHEGDFGNIPVNADGTVEYYFSDWQARLYGFSSILGKAMVVHAGTDDLGRGDNAESRKTGNAGSRLACCVINGSE